MSPNPSLLVPEDFSPVPSTGHRTEVTAVDALDEATLDALAVVVTSDGDLPGDLGADLDREALGAVGFEAKAGSSLVVPRSTTPVLVLVGAGASGELDAATVRDAAATAARASATFGGRLGIRLPSTGVDAELAGQVLTEGALLARYRYTALRAEHPEKALTALALAVDGADSGTVGDGIRTGLVTTRAAAVARDLANSPPAHLTASAMADVAAELGAQHGFSVESFGREQLVEMRCGGLLGVNAGSTEEPRMVVLRYTPDGGATGHLGLVGKGIMYDSGGISIKPSDPMHLLMKMDMGGAAAVLGAFTALRDLGVTTAVTGWLMCTDNMPSGSAYKLGDVLTARNGTTVEVKNTDAEGRLAMMDALALAVEEGVDAIVDIATLTGAILVALGQSTAGLFGNDEALVGRVQAAAASVDEPVWHLPLEKKYRKQLDSEIADISNLGGPYAGSTTAALFLAEFVGETPWAHVDIAGTMQVDADEAWRSKGATGFGARLLAELARDFTPKA
ncbi:MAG TPA: leucyl aminopeptidase [Ornithinibacter sp.]|nr:leucyl aminopeptidase [Ornithinibacter sp.]